MKNGQTAIEFLLLGGTVIAFVLAVNFLLQSAIYAPTENQTVYTEAGIRESIENLTSPPPAYGVTGVDMGSGNAYPSVSLGAPNGGSYINGATLDFNYTPFDDYAALKNASLFTNETGTWESRALNASAITDGATNYFTYTLSGPGDFRWNVYLCDTAGQCAFAATNNTYSSYTSSGCLNNFTECNASITAGVYCLNQSIVAPGDCMVFIEDDIELDCKGYTITGPGFTKPRTGISLPSAASNITIRNCNITQFTTGMSLNVTNDSVFDNNNVSYNLYGINSSGGYEGKEANFTNNRLANNTWHGMNVNGNYTLISGNNASYSSNVGIYYSGKNSTLDNNFLAGNGLQGIYLDDVNFTSITGNTVFNTTYAGIYLEGLTGITTCYNNTISGNNVSYGGSTGIVLSETRFNFVTNNTVYYNNYSGIQLTKSYNNSILSNNVTANGRSDFSGYGLRLEFDANNNNVSNNFMCENVYYGDVNTQALQMASSGNNTCGIERCTQGGAYNICVPSAATTGSCSNNCPCTLVTSCKTLAFAGVYCLGLSFSSTVSCLAINVSDVWLYGNSYAVTGKGEGGGTGLAAGNTSNVTVTQCNFTKFDTGMSLEVTNSSNFSYNNISFNTDGIISQGGSVGKEANFTGNKVYNNTNNGINITGKYCTLNYNNVSYNTNYGTYMITEYSSIDNNRFDYNLGGIQLQESNFTNVTNNVAAANSVTGIGLTSFGWSVMDTKNNTVSNNNASNNSNGITLTNGQNHTVSNNYLCYNTNQGLSLSNTNLSRVNDNNASYNGNPVQAFGTGINLQWDAEANNVANNSACGNFGAKDDFNVNVFQLAASTNNTCRAAGCTQWGAYNICIPNVSGAGNDCNNNC
ncbi:hypothetical protein AUJ65_01135 [Candidatus Micrarchaeota archaeon CG1_02_51_15]|nr:MAG: hypothetical protein AUJ65_01135 [Candidatus Micrarchaeota archaeon CG1_02_51_15]